MLNRFIAALLVLLCAGSVRAGDRKMETRFFDLGAIVRESEESAFIPLGPIVGIFDDGWSYEGNSTCFLTGENVVALVRGSGLFGDGHDVWVDAEQLGVRAGPEELRAVERLLGRVRRAAARRIEVGIRLAEIEMAAGAGLLADPAFKSLATGTLESSVAAELLLRIRADGGSVRDVNTVSRPARRSSAGQVSKRSYVRDMGVEIAGGTVVGDPSVAWTREGWQVDVRPHLLAGGGTFLEVMLQTSRSSREARRVDLEGDELGRVELPALSQRTLYSTGCVPAGRVMSLVLKAKGRVAILLLEPLLTGKADEGQVDMTSLTGLHPGFSMSWSDDDDTACDRRSEADAELPQLSPPRLQLRHHGGRASISDNLMISVASRLGWTVEGRWRDTGRGIWMFGGPAEAEPVRKVLAEHEGRVLRTVPIALRVRWDDRDLLVANLLVVPGRMTCVSAGELRAYVGDWDVEVASENARIGDPETQWAWGGTAVNLLLDPGAEDGEWTARVTGEVSFLEDGFRTIRTGNSVTGIVESPRGRAVALDAEMLLPAGRPSVLKPADGVSVEITVGR